MKKYIVEVDTDGVLADMDGSYGPYITDIIPDFSEEKYIRGWSMPIIRDKYPNAHDIIKALWRDPDFIGNLPRFENVEDGMKALCAIPGVQVIVHTHIFNKEAGAARKKWLEKLRKDTGTNFKIDVCIGESKKTLDKVDVTIEDNINNLNRSHAKIKFLVRRAHNRDFGVLDIENADAAFVVDSFYDAVEILASIKEKSLAFA